MTARERTLLELPERRETRSPEFLLLGEAGGDAAFSIAADAIVPEYLLMLRASRSLSICSADTIVWVPPSVMVERGGFCTAVKGPGVIGERAALSLAVGVTQKLFESASSS